MPKLRWGVLGTSFISKVLCEAIHESNTGELFAIGSHSSGKADFFTETYPNIKLYETSAGKDGISGLEQLIADPNIDAIYIGLPNALHKDWIIKCLKAGKHVLCEKPFVLNNNEMSEVLNACKTMPSLICAEALMNLYHPFMQYLKQTIFEQIGDIVSFDAKYTCNIANIANSNFGGAIRNLGCYPVSLVRYLLDEEPIEMIVHSGVIGADGNIRKASMTLKFPHDVQATIATADDEPAQPLEIFSFCKIVGTTGSIEFVNNPWLPGTENNIIVHEKNGESKKINYKASKSLYTYEIDAVGNAVLAYNHSYHFQEAQHASLVSTAFSDGNVAVLDEWEIKTRHLVAHSLLLAKQM